MDIIDILIELCFWFISFAIGLFVVIILGQTSFEAMITFCIIIVIANFSLHKLFFSIIK